MSRPALNRKLVLEAPQRVPDGAGGYRAHWVPLGTLWADVTARSGREAGDISKVSYVITVRAAPFGSDARPTAEQRFRDGARVFNISAVAEAGPRFLKCYAQEEVAA